MADKNSFGPLKDVPFTFFSLECPVCGQVNEYRKIKSGAFIETKIDTDFCPQERIWTFPENQNLHPYLFLLLTCEKCFFTREAEAEFLEWNFHIPDLCKLKKNTPILFLNQKSLGICQILESVKTKAVPLYPWESALLLQNMSTGKFLSLH